MAPLLRGVYWGRVLETLSNSYVEDSSGRAGAMNQLRQYISSHVDAVRMGATMETMPNDPTVLGVDRCVAEARKLGCEVILMAVQPNTYNQIAYASAIPLPGAGLAHLVKTVQYIARRYSSDAATRAAAGNSDPNVWCEYIELLNEPNFLGWIVQESTLYPDNSVGAYCAVIIDTCAKAIAGIPGAPALLAPSATDVDDPKLTGGSHKVGEKTIPFAFRKDSTGLANSFGDSHTFANSPIGWWHFTRAVLTKLNELHGKPWTPPHGVRVHWSAHCYQDMNGDGRTTFKARPAAGPPRLRYTQNLLEEFRWHDGRTVYLTEGECQYPRNPDGSLVNPANEQWAHDATVAYERWCSSHDVALFTHWQLVAVDAVSGGLFRDDPTLVDGSWVYPPLKLAGA